MALSDLHDYLSNVVPTLNFSWKSVKFSWNSASSTKGAKTRYPHIAAANTYPFMSTERDYNQITSVLLKEAINFSTELFFIASKISF